MPKKDLVKIPPKPDCAPVTKAMWKNLVRGWYDLEIPVPTLAAQHDIRPNTLYYWMARAGVPKRRQITRTRPYKQVHRKTEEDILKEEIAKRLDDRIEPLPKFKNPYKALKQRRVKGDPEVQVALLSDCHPGVKTVSFNCDVFRKRLKYYTERVIKIAQLHRNAGVIDELHLFCLGDLINGEKVGRNVNSEEFECPVDDQIFKVFAPAFIEMLLAFSAFYKKVTVHSVWGNHGPPAGRESAYGTNWDTICVEYCKARLGNYDNIHWHIERKAFYQIVEILGHYFVLSHGDQIPIYLNIPFYGITNRALRLQSSADIKHAVIQRIWEDHAQGKRTDKETIERMSRAPFQYFVTGHFHVANILDFNDLTMITNGTFKSHDQWVLKRMGLGVQPKQITFGMHPRKGMTWEYKILLDS